MRTFHGCLTGALPLFLIGVAGADSAVLSVEDLVLSAGQSGEVVVSGDVPGKGTFGVEILVEIVPRPDNVGTVTFTPSPPVDVEQRGDPWPGAGLFSPFDTDALGFSSTLNGSVDDDGQWLCSNVLTYSGPLTAFPVIASADAVGVWDVVLSTSAGDSGWVCIPSTLIPGTITISPPVPAISTWGLAALSLLLLSGGCLVLSKRKGLHSH